jgi:transcriptional regulator with XRE-family HTH domain
MRIEEVVGRRLREAREEAGMTQQQLGEAMANYLEKKWPGQQVSLAEDGKRKFSAEELFALCEILMRPASYFFIPGAGVSDIDVPGRNGVVAAERARETQTWTDAEGWTAQAPVVAAILKPQATQLRDIQSALGIAAESLELVDSIIARRGDSTEELETLANQTLPELIAKEEES